MRLYNTLSRTSEIVKPLHPPHITLYCCGPTVYDFTHVGHLRKYTMDDVLRRVLTYLGYTVTHVMNITDVGHLVSDGDEGEDKMEKGARKQGKTVWEVAKLYTDYFHTSMRHMCVQMPHTVCKATEHIDAMIQMIQTLEKKGFTYDTPEAVYFDITRAVDYEKLSGQKLSDKRIAVRSDVIEDTAKKNPADFALWFKRVGKFADHMMHWNSPWGDGFPGWHIECSAMACHYLGDQIDIHTGGIDHIPVHHTDEIAQSESATGKRPFVRYWVHHNFLKIEGEKMSKSLGNFLTIDDIIAKGYSPLALRLLFLQSHYRSEMNFTWHALESSSTALQKLIQKAKLLVDVATDASFWNDFESALSDDLNTPQAIAHLFAHVQARTLGARDFLRACEVLGLSDVLGYGKCEVPVELQELAQKRAAAKRSKDYTTADAMRAQIETAGYRVRDLSDGTSVVEKA